MKKILFTLLLSGFVMHVQAQEEEVKKGFQKDRLFVGGNFGLSFGNYTLINLSPQIGYRFSKLLAAGVGMNGQYISYKDRDFNGNTFRKVSQGVTGLNVFGRLYPTNQLFLQVQPEANYIFGRETYYDTNPHEVYKIDPTIAPSLLLGGGAVFGSGGRGGMIISIMYDVLQHQKSPYGNKPVYNVGFTVGL
jgi:hypothetical protein